MRVTRLVSPDDAPVLAQLRRQNLEFLTPFQPAQDDEHLTVGYQRKRIATLLELHDRGECVPYVIMDSADSADSDPAVVGQVTINNIVRGAFQSGSIGYWVSEHATGRGLASRAVAELKLAAFTRLELHRLEAGTLTGNIRSQRVLERNGFERYGLAPRYLKIAGRWQDHILFQVLNE